MSSRFAWTCDLSVVKVASTFWRLLAVDAVRFSRLLCSCSLALRIHIQLYSTLEWSSRLTPWGYLCLVPCCLVSKIFQRVSCIWCSQCQVCCAVQAITSETSETLNVFWISVVLLLISPLLRSNLIPASACMVRVRISELSCSLVSSRVRNFSVFSWMRTS